MSMAHLRIGGMMSEIENIREYIEGCKEDAVEAPELWTGRQALKIVKMADLLLKEIDRLTEEFEKIISHDCQATGSEEDCPACIAENALGGGQG